MTSPNSSASVWSKGWSEAQSLLQAWSSHPSTLPLCTQMSDWITETFQKGGNVFTCGNGGSHCDAMHFAEELTGRYRKDRRALGALALGDAAHTTCVANDYGFEHVFSRQLQGLGKKGDLLIGFSTSGNSKNQILAFESARQKGIRTIALLGKGGGALKNLADLAIVVPGETSDRIQEIHIQIVHIAIEAVERVLFPENY